VFDEISRAFRSPLWLSPGGEPFVIGPPVDLYETDTEVVMKAALPGMTREDIDLTIDGDSLILSGESKHDEEVKEEGYYRREMRHGSFCRSVTLPVPVDPDGLQASFDNGVLTVHAPKSEQATQRKIEVTTSTPSELPG